MSSPATPPPGNWLSAETFTGACSALPLVSIDLMITRAGAAGEELLLGLRSNPPAMGWWFTPGGRIRKNEPLQDAMLRIALGELNLSKALLPRATLLGAWDHFYPDSAFSPDVSTHYVNLAYWLPLDSGEERSIAPPEGTGQQHTAWQWMPLSQAAQDEAVHTNVRIVAELISTRCAQQAETRQHLLVSQTLS
jgi:colanic acid biosynthesis protein WcaH